MSVADDTYLLSGSPRGLQGALDIINFFGKRYRIVFNADKTKLIVTGSKHDMEYYRDVNIWKLNDEGIEVAIDTLVLLSLVSMKRRRILMLTYNNAENLSLDF